MGFFQHQDALIKSQVLVIKLHCLTSYSVIWASDVVPPHVIFNGPPKALLFEGALKKKNQ
ncbi:hypothetical protein DVA76_18170 [Acinetobacter baumannii]|nr:hypothetical protein DVA76_18170 [Acinetobacter baumannii]